MNVDIPGGTDTNASLQPGQAPITETKMIRPRLLTFAIGLAVVLSSVARADQWPLPRPLLFANGVYAFKSLPDKAVRKSGEVMSRINEGVFFTLDNDGNEEVIWRAKLVNIPVRAIVAESGKYVITLDTWVRVGYEHCLVVYGEKGKVIADFKLEDLLTAQEIESLPASASSRYWSGKNIAEFEDRSLGHHELVIRMKHKDWAKVIRLSLSSGKLVKE